MKLLVALKCFTTLSHLLWASLLGLVPQNFFHRSAYVGYSKWSGLPLSPSLAHKCDKILHACILKFLDFKKYIFEIFKVS